MATRQEPNQLQTINSVWEGNCKSLVRSRKVRFTGRSHTLDRLQVRKEHFTLVARLARVKTRTKSISRHLPIMASSLQRPRYFTIHRSSTATRTGISVLQVLTYPLRHLEYHLGTTALYYLHFSYPHDLRIAISRYAVLQQRFGLRPQPILLDKVIERNRVGNSEEPRRQHCAYELPRPS